MTDNKYRQLVADMKGGVGWRDLRRRGQRRHSDRDVEITDVECVVVEGNFPWNLIRVETDAGEYGIGEAFPGPASEFVEFLRPGLVGENPCDLDRLVEHMTQLLSGLGGTSGYAQAAVSGIEIALFDVVGKLTDLPAYQLLGGKYRDAVRIYADCHAGEALAEASGAAAEGETVGGDSGGADDSGTVPGTTGETEETYSPKSYAAVANDVFNEGFTAMKFDLDIPPAGAGERIVDTATRRLSRSAIEHMADVVAAVRDAVGPEPTVGFDVHWNYEVDTATALARAIEEYDVSWLEDPVPPDSVDAHRKVSESTSTSILSGENLTRVEGFLPFLTDQALDIVAPDVQKCGGLQEFRKIATLADAYNVPVAPHNISSPVGTVASVHACASVPNAFVLEYHAREVDWWDDLLLGDDALIRAGEIAVPESPGLGITLDDEVLEANLAPGESGFDR